MKVTELSQRLKEAMRIRGYKQIDLVENCGFEKGQVSAWVAGRYKPRQNNIDTLARFLNVSESWLMGYDDPMERTPIERTSDEIFYRVMAQRKHTFYELTDDEEGIITIYRQLDEYGRKAVKSSLNNEYDRVMSQSELLAAHSGNELTQEQVKAILDFKRGMNNEDTN